VPLLFAIVEVEFASPLLRQAAAALTLKALKRQPTVLQQISKPI
jgi:hypothetical protein